MMLIADQLEFLLNQHDDIEPNRELSQKCYDSLYEKYQRLLKNGFQPEIVAADINSLTKQLVKLGCLLGHPWKSKSTYFSPSKNDYV